MELTIGELAARVGMTSRNIREWQTIGVLPAPERRGRTAFYDEGHVNRITRIKSLRADGFPLDIIRQFLDRSQESAADILALSSTVLDPASRAGTSTLSRAELRRRLGDGAEDALVGCGLLDSAKRGRVMVKDVATFEYVEQLVGLGLPVGAVANALGAMLHHQTLSVTALVDLYRDEIWQPFVDAGLPAGRFRAIAESSGLMRELVIGLGGQTLRRATDLIIAEVAVEQATKLDERH